MTTRSELSRRRSLQLLLGAPMLPLAGSVAAGLLEGARNTAHAASAFRTAKFVGMEPPTLADPTAMATTTVGSRLQVTLADGSVHDFKLAYEPFFTTGDMLPDGKGGTILAGGYLDIDNKPIVDRSVPGQERQVFSNSPDGTSLLSVPDARVAGVKGNPVFAVVQFEYTTANLAGDETYATLPSPIAVLTLDQDPTTGKLSLVKYQNVDTSGVHGLWISCGASLSPWNTHLSSEEYEPDAPSIAANKRFKAFSRNLYGNETKANPYNYGHIPEVTVLPDGTGTIKKHFNLGRISHELIRVMPDNRTVLMGDDATNSGLFLFIADRERDLSEGTLYVAKLNAPLVADPAAPPAPLSWIKLGHATSAEIEQLANSLTPDDIMTVHTSDPKDPSFTRILANGAANWVKVKPGMEKAAAFLETHRYAYLMGGSMGFTKMEGTTVNRQDKVAYSALQNMVDSMVKGGRGWNAESNIGLDAAVNAGAILAHKLSGGQKDISGAAMDSEWVPVATGFLLVSKDTPADEMGNLAPVSMVANPDNLKFSETLRTLFIGEDSSQHVNNYLWAYNVDTKKLALLLSTPAGAEFDRAPRGGRAQWVDLHHVQFPARRRLAEVAARQGPGAARSSRSRELQKPLCGRGRLSDRRTDQSEARLTSANLQNMSKYSHCSHSVTSCW